MTDLKELKNELAKAKAKAEYWAEARAEARAMAAKAYARFERLEAEIYALKEQDNV